MFTRTVLTVLCSAIGLLAAAAPASAQSIERDSTAWYPIRLSEPTVGGEIPKFTVGAKLIFMSVRTDGSDIVQSRRGPRIRDRYDLSDLDTRGPGRWREPTRGTLAASARLRF